MPMAMANDDLAGDDGGGSDNSGSLILNDGRSSRCGRRCRVLIVALVFFSCRLCHHCVCGGMLFLWSSLSSSSFCLSGEA